MKVLVLGGTGQISRGIVRRLLEMKAQVTLFNRGNHPERVPPGVEVMVGDRDRLPEMGDRIRAGRFDAAVDMVCFRPEQARQAVDALGGSVGHYVFCSTVCTYGTYFPGRSGLKIREDDPQEPVSGYGRDKLECEKVFFGAHRAGRMKVTVFRPSCTYGPGGNLIDNLGWDSPAWDRMERGLPVLCADSGQGLWQACHADDAGVAFARALGRPACFGKAYNLVHDGVMTWNEYYGRVAAGLGTRARIVYLGADEIIARDPARFSGLAEIFRFHGAYDNAALKRDVPEFRQEVPLERGSRGLIEDMKQRGIFRKSEDDPLYASLVEKALEAGKPTS